MTGETHLKTLLQTMEPELNPEEYVFGTVSPAYPARIPSEEILAFFREQEGVTLVLRRAVADHYQVPYSFVAAWITLKVHSALEAVGLTAAFSRALADHHISCNVIAGFYHDHLFVEKKDADKALLVLKQLASAS